MHRRCSSGQRLVPLQLRGHLDRELGNSTSLRSSLVYLPLPAHLDMRCQCGDSGSPPCFDLRFAVKRQPVLHLRKCGAAQGTCDLVILTVFSRPGLVNQDLLCDELRLVELRRLFVLTLERSLDLSCRRRKVSLIPLGSSSTSVQSHRLAASKQPLSQDLSKSAHAQCIPP